MTTNHFTAEEQIFCYACANYDIHVINIRTIARHIGWTIKKTICILESVKIKKKYISEFSQLLNK